MKILAVATFAFPDHFGGAERVITEVCQRLAQRGHSVTLTTSRPKNGLHIEERGGVTVRRYDVDDSSPAAFYRSVFSGVRTVLADLPEQPDVVHLHQILSSIAALAPGSPLRGVPVAGSFYAPYHREYLARFRQGRDEGAASTKARFVAGILAKGDRYVLKRCTQILALSDFSVSQINEILPDAVERTTVAPAGIDLDRFHPIATEAERQATARFFSLPDSCPLLLSVRRLVPRMGLTDLIEATDQLSQGGANAHLALAGEGESREALQSQVEKAGLEKRVTFLGRVEEEDLPRLYQAASIFILPTRALEGFGMATAEALASGLPIVATDVGATREVLEGCHGALLVPPGDPLSLARALSSLLDNTEQRGALGHSARSHAEGHFHWDHHLDAVEKVLDRARGGPKDA